MNTVKPLLSGPQLSEHPLLKGYSVRKSNFCSKDSICTIITGK